MKFRLPAKELAHALTGLTKVIAHNTSLPVLRGVRIQAQGKSVRLTGTDLDCFATYTCQSAEVLENGCAVIADTRRLKAIVQSAKSEETVLRSTNEDTVEVGVHGPRGDRLHVLVALPADDFPQIPHAIKTEPADPLFLEHYRRLLPFSSTDSTRHTLESVCCEAEKGEHLMIATDGRRLATANSLSLPFNKTVIMPKSKFLGWSQLNGETQIGIHPKHLWMRVVCGEWDAAVRLIEGTYPNWRQVVPSYTEEATRFVLSEEDVPTLLEAVKTLPGADQSTRPVTLMAGTPHPRIAACDPESGVWSYQALPNSTWHGDALGITVDRSYLADAVKAGFRSFLMQDDMSPLLSRDNGNLHVLMPVRGSLPPELEKAQAKRREQSVKDESAHDEANPSSEAETDSETETPTRKETSRMIKPKNNGRTDNETPDLWTQFQTVKEKARELNTVVAELGQSIKGFHKEQKTVRSELQNARGALSKLQSINI